MNNRWKLFHVVVRFGNQYCTQNINQRHRNILIGCKCYVGQTKDENWNRFIKLNMHCRPIGFLYHLLRGLSWILKCWSYTCTHTHRQFYQTNQREREKKYFHSRAIQFRMIYAMKYRKHILIGFAAKNEYFKIVNELVFGI